MNIKILIIALFVSTGSLFAQNNSISTAASKNKLQNYEVKVSDPIGERDDYLLRKDLKAASDILEYVAIKWKDGLVTFKPYENEVNLYTPILDKYFQNYKIYQSDKLIYTSNAK